MKSVKIKVKKYRTKEMTEALNEALGTGGINMDICWGKYLQMGTHIERCVGVLELFNDKSRFYERFPEMIGCKREIGDFIVKAKSKFDNMVNLTAYENKFSEMADEDKSVFSTTYEELKNSEVVTQLIGVCDVLIKHKVHLENPKALNHKFIVTMPGVEFCPFPFSKLNIKQVICNVTTSTNNVQSPVVDLIMVVLNKLYGLTYSLYKLVSSPDVDIDKFVDTVRNNIGEARKHIPRCDKAFDTLISKVEMLKGNFPTYHRDMLTSGNPGIIFEHFVIDVAHSTKADLQLMRQFNQIIGHYRKKADGQIKDPRLESWLNKLQKQFSRFDKYDNIVKATDAKDGDEESSSEESSDDEVDPVRVANAAKSADELAKEFEEMGKN